jgi:hypothetical protein
MRRGSTTPKDRPARSAHSGRTAIAGPAIQCNRRFGVTGVSHRKNPSSRKFKPWAAPSKARERGSSVSHEPLGLDGGGGIHRYHNPAGRRRRDENEGKLKDTKNARKSRAGLEEQVVELRHHFSDQEHTMMTALRLDAMYYSAARRSLKRARIAEPRVANLLRHFEKLSAAETNGRLRFRFERWCLELILRSLVLFP